MNLPTGTEKWVEDLDALNPDLCGWLATLIESVDVKQKLIELSHRPASEQEQAKQAAHLSKAAKAYKMAKTEQTAKIMGQVAKIAEDFKQLEEALQDSEKELEKFKDV
ncbi:hypothetical protein H4219_003169, partial [Mycoemilia scoparia]